MKRLHRHRASQRFPKTRQSVPGQASPVPSIESALRTAIRKEATGPVASLTAALNRLANRLAREPKQAQPARTGRNTGPTAATKPVPAPMEAAPPAAAAPAPTASACAVIGCKRPHRSQGYCAAHYQKRRLMVATGRLHAAWVEDAAPHSIPDVILPRGRRPKADAAPPAPKPPVSATPRMWVRKKGQLPDTTGPNGAAGADGASGAGAPTPAGNLASDRERATATAQRWASEFRSRTRRA